MSAAMGEGADADQAFVFVRNFLIQSVKEPIRLQGFLTVLSMSKEGDTTLKSICYKPGSLQLLDQRKLPFEKIYLEIRDAADGWIAIHEMVVRGAPAIAISAALSLAVEVFNFNSFIGSSADVVEFLGKKLDCLVSSRPTSVNLADAAVKLKQVLTKALVTATEPKSIFKAYIEAAEEMLKDDFASNKAIRTFGSSLLRQQAKNPDKLSVLTHCNTGSSVVIVKCKGEFSVDAEGMTEDVQGENQDLVSEFVEYIKVSRC